MRQFTLRFSWNVIKIRDIFKHISFCQNLKEIDKKNHVFVLAYCLNDIKCDYDLNWNNVCVWNVNTIKKGSKGIKLSLRTNKVCCERKKKIEKKIPSKLWNDIECSSQRANAFKQIIGMLALSLKFQFKHSSQWIYQFICWLGNTFPQRTIALGE